MKPSPIDWSARLAQVFDETFDIPPDVTFQIAENDLVHEVKAHKMVMGMASPVFKRMFFVSNTADKTAKEIVVKQTTKAAFQIMVSAIYNITSMEDSLKDKSVDEVFAVIYLVEKYQIPELLMAVKEYLSNFPLVDGTVLEEAANAMQFLTRFQEHAEGFLFTCAKFLKPKLKDAESVFRYMAEHEDQKDAVYKLLAMMKDIAPPKLKCPNCLQELCQDGIEIEECQFRVGLIVTKNPSCSYWCSVFRGKAKVTELEGAFVRVENIEGFPTNYYNMNFLGSRNFLFSCK